MALLEKIGFGQVEFNKVTSQVTKEIISTMPADSTIDAVEMGMFMVPDYTNGVMKFPAAEGDAAYIINNEIKNYEVNKARKDFRIESVAGSAHFVAQSAIPRGYKMHVGDTFHTNLIEDFDGSTAKGAQFVTNTNGILKKATDASTASMVFEVVKVSTMPDGQLAAKLVCTKAEY